ncbi:MAG: radical SAM family heme chaperone HemW [Candidatus Krumholzibacteriota bacterium]|nr:radical SAM family heme chaperone HemW [Candidatus Krumholzibacteriota bacterium]
MMNDIPAGLYVHVPFCRTKCPYCDFYSLTDLTTAAAFADDIRSEAELYRRDFREFDSLYLGGGTPSVLPAGKIARITGILRELFSLSESSEITIEVNPDDVTKDKLEEYKDAGFNRISVGVQSFVGGELEILGRRHDARRAERALQLIREEGFTNFGLDLIYGYQGQTRESWLFSLETALRFSPRHLSCYQLTLSDSTPLGGKRSLLRPVIFEEEKQRSFFLETSRLLTDRGYIHYEVSNYAREEKYIAVHNSRYWRHLPYLGLGPAAHSFRGGRRWWNLSSLRLYRESLREKKRPLRGEEELDRGRLLLEELMLGFRTREGVPLTLIREIGGGEEVLNGLLEEKLVVVNAGRAAPTREGFLLADKIPLRFNWGEKNGRGG